MKKQINQTKNYDSITALRKKLLEVVSPFNESDMVEFDVMYGVDQNKNRYAHIHIKDYGGDYRKIICAVKKFLSGSKYSEIDCGYRKKLIWLPMNKNVKEIVEDGVKYKVK